jgi:Contact-dependent growth inhibition CdiA C-terminal domain
MSVAELVPLIAGDMDVLAGHARGLDSVGAAVTDIGARVHASWQALGAVYRAPEAEQLLAATAPVQAVSASVGEDVQAAAAALSVYAAEVRDIQTRLEVLRAEAVSLDTALAGGGASALTDQRNALVVRIAASEADFEDAQRRCASHISALTGTSTATPAAAFTLAAPAGPGPSELEEFAAGAGAVIGETLDFLGAFGVAALNNPVEVVGIASGAALTSVSALGFVGSLALDGTGVGLPAGLPAGVVTAGGIAAGLTIVAASTTSLVEHALHDGRTAPIDTGGPTAAVPAEPDPNAAAPGTGSAVNPGRIDDSARPFMPDERRLAEKLAAEGKEVTSLPESADRGTRTPDAEVDGVPTEFKTIQPDTNPADSSTVRNILRDSKARGGQARTIIIDGEQSTLTLADAARGVARHFGTGSRYYESITIRTTQGTYTYP